MVEMAILFRSKIWRGRDGKYDRDSFAFDGDDEPVARAAAPSTATFKARNTLVPDDVR